MARNKSTKSQFGRCRKPLLPEGTNTVALEHVEEVPSKKYPGTMVREFLFSHSKGEITRTIARTLRLATDAHTFVESLFGHAIKVTDDIPYHELVGRRYEIVVSRPHDGPPLITSVKLIAD